jgi:hypothetical protein
MRAYRGEFLRACLLAAVIGASLVVALSGPPAAAPKTEDRLPVSTEETPTAAPIPAIDPAPLPRPRPRAPHRAVHRRAPEPDFPAPKCLIGDIFPQGCK